MFFSAAGDADIARCLAAGADPNARDDDDWTPLHLAVRSRSAEGVTVLVAARVGPNVRDDDGWAPLHEAVSSIVPGRVEPPPGTAETVTTLLAAGADPDVRSTSGTMPLDLAVDFPEVLAAFADGGAVQRAEP